MGSEVIREAGILERVYETRYALGIDACVVVSAAYSSPNVSLDRSTVYRALEQVIHKHPALCVQLSGEVPTTPRWVRLPSINLDDIVTFSSDALADGVETILVTESAKPLPGPALWRITVFKDGHVLLAYHHAIGDGRSGLAFHRSFLQALNSMSMSHPADVKAIIDTPKDIALTEPAENAMDVSVSFTTLLRMLAENLILPRSWVPSATAWTGRPCPPEPHNRVHVRLHSITSSDAGLLLALCRKNSCTLTSFLHTVAIRVLSDIVHKLNAAGSDSKPYSSLSLVTAFDLRPFTGCSEHTMSTQAAAHTYLVPLLKASDVSDASFPWDVAKEFSSVLQDYRKKSKENVGLAKLLYRKHDPVKFFLGKLGQKRENTLGLSNLGRFPAEVNGTGSTKTWSIGNVFFYTYDAAVGPTFMMTVVGSPSGTVNVIYNWIVDAVDDSVADAFVVGMKEGVNSVLHT